MKKLLATLLIFFILCGNSFALVVGYSRTFGGASCTTTNDSQIVDESGTQNGTGTSVYNAGVFTLSATTTITEYKVTISDLGSDVGNIRVSLYTNNAGEPGTEITNTNVNVAMSAVPASETVVIVTLPTPKEGLTSGDYWLVNKEENSASRNCYRKADVGNNRYYSTDGTTWLFVADQTWIFEIWGCQ